MHPLSEIINKNKTDHRAGIYSCCSANPFVLEAALRRGRQTGTYVLIEATANQVNQYGGYMGMTPQDFAGYVKDLAAQCDFPAERLILGGDHLGPLTFAGMAEDAAMAQAEELVAAYVRAGFTKIHLDTSMKLASDDPALPLSLAVVAARGARLCAVCERAFTELKERQPEAAAPVYIIGSEVPVPGGTCEVEEQLAVTGPEDADATIREYERCFRAMGLADVWPRVAGLVVQPGVEFGDNNIFEYNMQAAAKLKTTLDKLPQMTFEAHSTDYQTRAALKEMVADGFSILKVGPGLTFALREALFALDIMEREMARSGGFKSADFRRILLEEMRADSSAWQKHYLGTDEEIFFKFAYSFCDRSRYYLTRERVRAALEKLLVNLEAHPAHLSLLSQHMPGQYFKVRNHQLENRPHELIVDKIQECIDDYLYATDVI